MNGVAIYMEGGGDGPAGKAQIRTGMSKFLSSLQERVSARRYRWRVTPCGSRNAAFDAYKNAVQTNVDTLNLLLVDSEGPLSAPPWAHLAALDRWDLGVETANQVHLMVQTMETWIVADGEALAKYYGSGFRAASLPAAKELELVSKNDVARALKAATKNTTKGDYHKIRHAADLLARLDAPRVRSKCPACERLFASLEAIL